MTSEWQRIKARGNPPSAPFSKQPRQAKVRTQQSFSSSTTKDGETKAISPSKKRPGKLKWVPRGYQNSAPTTPEGKPIPTRTSVQARQIGSTSRYADLTTLERAVQERYGAHGQSFK